MPEIKVYRINTPNQEPLGIGDGNINENAKTAVIEQWKHKKNAGLKPTKKYKLEVDKASYTATCQRVGTGNPVASFNNLEWGG
jgi:hypothetical protein